MRLADALLHTTEEIRAGVHRTAEGLDAAALAWRPDAEANSIAWLLWHLSRVQDAQVAHIAGRGQVWSPGWAERFGLPAGYDDSGYGHGPDDVARITPDRPEPLTAYQDEVAQFVGDCVAPLQPDDFDRVIDRSYDPPVTVGVRLLSLTADALQHLGQAGYVRGLWQRRR